MMESLLLDQSRVLVSIFITIAQDNAEVLNTRHWSESDLQKLNSNVARFVELLQVELLRPESGVVADKREAYLYRMVRSAPHKRTKIWPFSCAGTDHVPWRVRDRLNDDESKIRSLQRKLKLRNEQKRVDHRDDRWFQEFVRGTTHQAIRDAGHRTLRVKTTEMAISVCVGAKVRSGAGEE